MPAAALEDSRRSLSARVPALGSRIVQDLSESCFSYLRSALEVPRLYRRTNKVSAAHWEGGAGGEGPVGRPQGGVVEQEADMGVQGQAGPGPHRPSQRDHV